MWTFVAVLVLLTAGHNAQNYDRLRGILHHVCPDEQVVSQINSSYSPNNEDRQWKIDCKDFGATTNCSWSGFHNLYEEELKYNCPANHVVAGVHSNYNSARGGRSWNFLCCSSPNLITSECRETPMVNYWNEDFDWQLPGGQLLTGVQTYSDNNKGDDRWSFNYCKGTIQDTQTITSQILTINQPIEDLLTEGDVVVPTTRNARICSDCRWPKLTDMVEVPYAISDSFNSSERIKIYNAIRAFEMSTCIRFVSRVGRTSDYISIVKQTGCHSPVGRTGGSQEVSLGAGCLRSGVIQHELIHSLGFWHEQSRNDRDLFVSINYENIKKGHKKNFYRRETNNLAVPYDYSSVMHYGAKSFSKNGEDTITPLTPSAQIGQRVGMSDNDILKINKLYDCKNYLNEYDNWDNQLSATFTRQCPSGQAVSGFTSLFNNDQTDRLWAVSCKAFKVTNACKWSGYVNKYLGKMDFKCPDNDVIAGAYSEYKNNVWDRRWKFYCCHVPDFVTFNCQKTPKVNYFKEYFSWTVASGNFVTGVKSSFDDSTQDRRWSFSYCEGIFDGQDL